MVGGRRQLFTRFEGNPILTPDRWPYTVNAVFNPGVAIDHTGATVLLVRVEDRSGVSHFTVARSADGFERWEIDGQPTFLPDLGSYEEGWGVEDARITRIGEDFLITYTGFSRGGPLVGLAVTRDFRTFERRGVITPPEDKDAALFPQQFGGRWALLHRPVTSGAHRLAAHIWISWSPDLRHWGDHRILLHAREGAWWDTVKVGLGPPPLLTDLGWLLLFHGVKETAAGLIYRAGLALLDRDDPVRVLARSSEWVFGPEADYERTGDVPDVVFPTGWVVEPDGETVRMYYGAADTSVAVASARVGELLAFLLDHCVCGRPHQPGDRCPYAAGGGVL